MELFTVIMLAVDAALVVAIVIRARSGERPPREDPTPTRSKPRAS